MCIFFLLRVMYLFIAEAGGLNLLFFSKKKQLVCGSDDFLMTARPDGVV
jgi:hypothetical protein